MKRALSLVAILLFVFSSAAAPRDREPRDRGSAFVKIVKKIIRALDDLPAPPKPEPCTANCG